MNTKLIIQSLGLATVMAASAGTFAHGNDDAPRYGFPGYGNPTYGNPPAAFHTQPGFQESLRLINEVNDRQDTQMARILKGFYDKRINPMEFRKLMDEQQDIRRMERGFLGDGVLTRVEFQKLDAALDAASRNIAREGRDSDGKPGWGGWNNNPYGGGYGYWNR